MGPRSNFKGKQLLLITGMHRSGTSFITSLCSAFGLSLPVNLIPPDRWNQKGYFEAAEVVNAQERLLASLGRGWFDLHPFPADWLEQVPGRVCMAELRSFLETTFDESSVLVIKDPRSSLLIPLWTKIADEYEIDLRILVVVRRPGQVARSLDLRDHMNPLIGLALWWTHTLCALRGAAGRRNGVVIYENVLRRPRVLFNLLKEDLGIIDERWSAEIERRALDCADEDLNHSALYNSTETMPFSGECDHLYQRLCGLSRVPVGFDVESPKELEAVLGWFPEWRRLFVKHAETVRELQELKSSQPASFQPKIDLNGSLPHKIL